MEATLLRDDVTMEKVGGLLENHVGSKENEPRGSLEWRGPDIAPYRREYEKENDEAADDWMDLGSFIDVLNRARAHR